MANYKKLAATIIEKVGGKENVSSVTHCMTRLRLVLKDEGLASDDALNAIPEIISVVRAGGQVQLVIGPTVDKVYDAVCAEGGFEVQAAIDENLDAPKLPWKERFAPKRIGNLLYIHISTFKQTACVRAKHLRYMETDSTACNALNHSRQISRSNVKAIGIKTYGMVFAIILYKQFLEIAEYLVFTLHTHSCIVVFSTQGISYL